MAHKAVFPTSIKIQVDLVNKKGSSTLEFIFCAPLLLMVMFVAMELNERIEQRVTVAIASGNSIWLADPKAPSRSSDAAASLAKADILATKSVSSPEMVGPGQVQNLIETEAVLTYSETKRRADAYVAKLDRVVGDAADLWANKRSRAEVGETRIDFPGRTVARAAVEAKQVIDKITHPDVKWLPHLFPKDLTEQQILSWSVSNQGSTNAAIDAIRNLSEFVNKSDTKADLDRFGAPEYRILAAKMAFLRRDPAFHPDAYENQSLYGMVLSLTAPREQSAFSHWVKDCFMSFKRETCSQRNGFVPYVENVHATVFSIKTMIDTAQIIACAFGPISCAPAEAAKRIAKNAVDEVIKTVEMEIENQISDSIERAINEKFNQISQKTRDEMGRAMEEIPQRVGGRIESEINRQIQDILKDREAASGQSSPQ